MKFPQPIPVSELARQLDARLLGDPSLLATGINEIHRVEAGDITFADIAKYAKRALTSAATILLLPEAADCPPGKAILVCDQPFEAYNKLVKKYRPFRPLSEAIHPSAFIHPSAIIEPGVCIGPDVKIGAYTYIQSNVYIAEYSQIGQHVKIQAGCVIGTAAFYLQRSENGYAKWCSGGRVVIEDRVEIGAGCTINKGVSSETIIGRGSQLDCQVHVGHGVRIGQHCVIAGQVGIGGKAILEDWVTLYGQVGVAQGVTIGKRAVVSAKSGVSKSLVGGKIYAGVPAEEIRDYQKRQAIIRRMANDWSADHHP